MMRSAALLVALALGLGALGGDYWGVGELLLLEGARDGALGGILSAPVHLPEAVRLNPAGLAFAEGIRLGSDYVRGFGALDFLSLAAAGRYWGVWVSSLDAGPLGDDLSYTAYGAVLALGIPLGDLLGVGMAWKGFFQGTPGEAFGWALDPALALRGDGFLLGIVWENAAAAPVDYGDHAEPWAPGVRAGAAVALEFGGVRLTAVGNLRYRARYPLECSAGLEVGGSDWAFRLGYGSAGASLGASLGFRGYGVHWALLMHPHLPVTVAVGVSWASGR